MARLELDTHTDIAPKRIIEALTDFSPNRPDIFPGIAPKYYAVYAVGETNADIREGTGAPAWIWAMEHYDWSQPNTVTWTVTDSNFCKPGSYVKLTATPSPDGGSDIHIEWEREPLNLKGKLLLKMVVAAKGKPILSSLEKAFENLRQSTDD